MCCHVSSNQPESQAVSKQTTQEGPKTTCPKVRPCSHNMWFRYRRLRQATGVVLKCYTCGALWTTNMKLHQKCSAFYAGNCTKGGECPCPHVFARGALQKGSLKDKEYMPLRELQERRKSSAESSVATATATTKSRKPSLQSNVTEPPALSMDFLHDRDSASDTASTKSSNFVVKEVTKFGQAMAPRRPSLASDSDQSSCHTEPVDSDGLPSTLSSPHRQSPVPTTCDLYNMPQLFNVQCLPTSVPSFYPVHTSPCSTPIPEVSSPQSITAPPSPKYVRANPYAEAGSPVWVPCFVPVTPMF